MGDTKTIPSNATPTPQAQWRCIKPHCPSDCSGCRCAIPVDEPALVLIADLLDALAVDGHGGPFEDGEMSIVDRARNFLSVAAAARAAAPPAHLPVPCAALKAIVDEVMEGAVKRGANSISMPDEYVAAAHFVSFPEKYGVPHVLNGASDA